MSENANLTYYQRNWDVILNRAKGYYENNKERLREQARDKYRNLSEEDKMKKREYGKNRYHNMPEEKRQKLKEYQKNTKKNIEKQKSLSIIMNKIVYVLFLANYSSLSISDSVSSLELLSDSLFSKSSSI